jgi:hypothetical protein
VKPESATVRTFKGKRPRSCPSCTTGGHARCAGASLPWGCACANDAHTPSDETAAAMRLFHRSDLDGDTIDNLAREWRERYEAGRVDAVIEVDGERLTAELKTGAELARSVGKPVRGNIIGPSRLSVSEVGGELVGALFGEPVIEPGSWELEVYASDEVER